MDNKELRMRKDKGPYDKSYEDNYSLYNNIPYTMDTNICNMNTHVLISGNLIKYNHYILSDRLSIINSGN